jgi:hypothetical protein
MFRFPDITDEPVGMTAMAMERVIRVLQIR